MTDNPHLLPKVRSRTLMNAISGMPCSLRVASFVPGGKCSDPSTVVGCHISTIGKGMGTKVSDLFVAAGCFNCHNIIDGRDRAGADFIREKYPTAFVERLMRGHHETLSRLYGMGIITVAGDQAEDVA